VPATRSRAASAGCARPRPRRSPREVLVDDGTNYAEWANGIDVGLGASVWSAGRDRAKEIAARLEAGTVWINGHGGIHPMVPFGGAKHSGYGLEFGVEGLKSVSVPQVING
jgi:acyl-CoA reductase-like NAD-dependent aldehyde dehydrogenase